MSLRSPVVADRPLRPAPPRSEHWRDLMLDAVIVAAAVVARAEGPPRAAAKMCLLAETRRAGLLAMPPQRDVLASFAVQSAALAHPAAARRIVARSMDAFVGTCWADTIAAVAASVAETSDAGASATAALAGVRRALGLGAVDRC